MHHQCKSVKKIVRTCYNLCQELCQQRFFHIKQNQQQHHHHHQQPSSSYHHQLQQQQQQRSLSTCVISASHTNISLPTRSSRPVVVKFSKCKSKLSLNTLMMIQTSKYSKFCAATEPPNLGSIPLCEERAHDLISNLKDSERAAIKTALAKYEAMRLKEGFEGKLAATQWRTRFGRLSRVPASTLGNVDPTGTYCAFPDDWLKKKAVERAKEPSKSDLMKLFMVNAVPFVGFGFLDNFTMIIAGDYIELLFGYFMCISTMAAAGLGNTISDIIGIGSAFYVERFCEMLGLKPPDLTPVQLELKSSRRAANYGRMIGITVGCLIGMTPLLFMDRKTGEKEKEKPVPEACK